MSRKRPSSFASSNAGSNAGIAGGPHGNVSRPSDTQLRQVQDMLQNAFAGAMASVFTHPSGAGRATDQLVDSTCTAAGPSSIRYVNADSVRVSLFCK